MLRIGSVAIAHPFTLAALSGYSDASMRRLSRRYGASYAVNEVVLDRSAAHEGAWQKRLLAVPADDHPIGGQLMGSDPADFGPAADRLVRLGYDVIDINFGCPVARVLKHCRGGYLLGEPDTACAIIRAVCDAVAGRAPVTVKLRRGLDDSAESRRRFDRVLDGALELGVAAVTLHARTVAQRYSGPADWQFLAAVRRRMGRVPLIGSGDLLTAEACLAMLRETGVDGVAIARGAIGNPWIFAACRAVAAGRPAPPPPGLGEQRAVLAAHLAGLLALYRGRPPVRMLWRLGLSYSRWHPTPKKVRAAIVAVRSPGEFERLLDEWYGGATGRESRTRHAPGFAGGMPDG